MTKRKCPICEREVDEVFLTTECPECYEKGALKERKKEQDRIIGLIDEWADYENSSNDWAMIVNELKREIKKQWKHIKNFMKK